jgi:hypothetical protein
MGRSSKSESYRIADLTLQLQSSRKVNAIVDLSLNFLSYLFEIKTRNLNFPFPLWYGSCLVHWQCCGSGMFIPDPDFYSFRIPDP